MADGRICYLQIPAGDPEASAAFYQGVFGWSLHRRADGRAAFDAPGGVSGQFVTGRPPSREAGAVLYVMVADIQTTIAAVVAHGGTVVEPPFGTGGGALAATFRDPYGNIFGLYQDAR